MFDGFEYKGVWWLPEKPEKRISGTLRFDPNKGIILDLIGSFKDIEDMAKLSIHEIILGVSSDGKNITLYKNIESKSDASFPGLMTSSFYVSKVFVGAHFRRSNDIKFKKLYIHYLYLDEWVNISEFTIQSKDNEKEVLIKYKLPESIQVNIDRGYKMFIIFEDIKHFSPPKKVSIEQKTYIQIEPSEEKSLDKYWSIMHHIQNFLTLGVTKPVYPLAIRGITEMNKVIADNRSYYPPVEIYYRPSEISEVSKTVFSHDHMLFTFEDIRDKFEILIKNWFEKANKLESIYNLYFGTLYNPRMYLEQHFLRLIHAIEAYHRQKFKGNYLPDKDYTQIFKKFEEFINNLETDNSFKEALKSRLKYGNEFSLRKRLKDLFEEYQEVLNDFVEDKKMFIDKVVNTRNYLTHYDESLKEKAADVKELYQVIQQLKIIMQICLLSELGFEREKIKDLLSRNRIYEDVFII